MMFRRIDALPSDLEGKWRDLLPSLEPLRKAVQNAQRIYFAPAASMACHDLAADLKALERARKQIFAPFERCWIEFADVAGIGVLWESEQGEMQRGSVKLLTWPGSHPIPVIYDLEADLANPFKPPLMLKLASQRALKAAQTSEGGPYVGSLIATGNWVAAPVLAAFALLATKGMTHAIPADMSKLNRQRAKAGKYPLMGYDEIRLNLDVERIVKNSRPAVGTGSMPQYQVRAHLRLIPSGRVVIVRAHIRGNPEKGIKRSHYTVMRDEDLL